MRRGYSPSLHLVFAVDALLQNVVLAGLGLLDLGEDQPEGLRLARFGHLRFLQGSQPVVRPLAVLEDLPQLRVVQRSLFWPVLRGVRQRRPGGWVSPEVDCSAVRVSPQPVLLCACE